jgi:alpha-L-fucosidase
MITRRNFIETGTALLAGAALRPRLAFAAAEAANPKLVLPTPAQIVWQDCEIGLLYSYDIAVAAGIPKQHRAHKNTLDPNLYQPSKLDTEQWMEAAKACGARYALFVASHVSGFMQWQSDAYPYGLKQTSWRDGKADVVGDFVASCRKAGIKPGIFFSDHSNAYNHVAGNVVKVGGGRGTPAQEKFNRIAEKQMEELCSRYGPLIEFWFDRRTTTPEEGGPNMLPIFEKHQPDAVFYSSAQRSDHRWIGNENGYAGNPCWATMPGTAGHKTHHGKGGLSKGVLSKGDPDGGLWMPAMADVALRNKWYSVGNHGPKPVDHLVQTYLNSVGRNCNLVIGVGITPEGLVPESDIKRLAEFGREIQQRWGKPVAETTGTGKTVELKLPAATRIANVIIMEDIAHGERIQNYTLAGQLADGQWQELRRGQSVGHKRIEQFPGIEVTAVRLQVDKSKAEPRVRKLAAYVGW